MSRKLAILTIALAVAALMAPAAFAASATSTTNVTLTVAAEAAITAPGTCALDTLSAPFGTWSNANACSVTFKVRTTKVGGTGSITALASGDWSGAGGPTLAGDTLTFTPTALAGGAGTIGTAGTISTTVPVTAVNFGTDAKTNSGSFSSGYSLPDNPAWSTGNYSVNVVFTITAN